MTCMSLSAIRQPFAIIDHSPVVGLSPPSLALPRRVVDARGPKRTHTQWSRGAAGVDVIPLSDTDRARDGGTATAVGGMHMSAAATIYNPGRVLVADGIVYVRELEEHDPEVVRIISESDDPLAAIRQCLRIGARALRAAHVTVDVDVIERSFHELETRFESRVTDAVDEIARTTSGLLDEDNGALVGALTTFRTEFDQLLGDTFDASSKVSVIAKIEELVLSTMKGLITPEIDDSPIGRLKKELVDTMQREVGDVADEVRRVTEHLGIVDATADAYEHTTAKGFDYEDFVDECVGELAAGYGDLAACTANEPGSCASKVGDEVVTLNRDDTHGVEARFTLEMKNRTLNMRKTLAELDQALANRDALAAIAVFRSQDAGTHVGAVPIQRRQGDRGARPRRRRRVRAPSRLHVGALDGAASARHRRTARPRPRADHRPAGRRLPLARAAHRDQTLPHARPARASTRPASRCATWSARCTTRSTSSTASCAPDHAAQQLAERLDLLTYTAPRNRQNGWPAGSSMTFTCGCGWYSATVAPASIAHATAASTSSVAKSRCTIICCSLGAFGQVGG